MKISILERVKNIFAGLYVLLIILGLISLILR
jgi:hypothetical protein